MMGEKGGRGERGEKVSTDSLEETSLLSVAVHLTFIFVPMCVLSSSCPGWQRRNGKERSKGPEGRAGSSRPGPALSCGMSRLHTRRQTRILLRQLFSSHLSETLHFPAFFPSSYCSSESIPQCCLCVTGSCWQGCDETKGLSEEAKLSSPPPLLPSGPGAPCPVVQYLCILLPPFPLFLSNHHFVMLSLDLLCMCSLSATLTSCWSSITK